MEKLNFSTFSCDKRYENESVYCLFDLLSESLLCGIFGRTTDCKKSKLLDKFIGQTCGRKTALEWTSNVCTLLPKFFYWIKISFCMFQMGNLCTFSTTFNTHKWPTIILFGDLNGNLSDMISKSFKISFSIDFLCNHSENMTSLHFSGMRKRQKHAIKHISGICLTWFLIMMKYDFFHFVFNCRIMPTKQWAICGKWQ